MKQLYAMAVIVQYTVPTRLQPNTRASLCITLTSKTPPLFVISAKRDVHIYFAKKTERYYAANVTFQSMEPMNSLRSITVSTSSISEYLIETLPGYCMEDLLDASFPPNGFCKEYEQQSLFQDRNNVHHHVNMCSFPLEAWSPSSTPT
ncbi:hypothetical protein PIB30_041228 [Stylosanthes scabra]|uniref:Uncharacterized protein n=1 Tax=Stylosanthes scabra TaxID=79078 RepID=A0ABU6SFQ1_9FABA|nr:hypothetical protein [Stylosanthes scabra]